MYGPKVIAAKKRCNKTLGNVISWVVTNLSTKLCGHDVLFGKLSTLPDNCTIFQVPRELKYTSSYGTQLKYV